MFEMRLVYSKMGSMNFEYMCPSCGKKIVKPHYEDIDISDFGIRFCWYCQKSLPQVVDLYHYKMEKLEYHTQGNLPCSENFPYF